MNTLDHHLEINGYPYFCRIRWNYSPPIKGKVVRGEQITKDEPESVELGIVEIAAKKSEWMQIPLSEDLKEELIDEVWFTIRKDGRP